MNKKTSTLSSWLFMMPSLFIIGVFLLYPLVNSIYLSFTNYNFVYSSKPEFIGFNNFKNLFRFRFCNSLKKHVPLYTGFFPINDTILFLLALLLNSKTRGTGFFQSAILLPMVVPLSLAGVAFTWILAEDFGILNHLLANILKLPQFTHFWLAEKGTALNSLAAVGLWKYVGFCVVLFFVWFKVYPG